MIKFLCEYFGPVDTDAVLSIVHGQFHGNNKVGVEIGMDNAQTIANDRALIRKYREWLKTQPRNIVRAYEYWLEHYERGCHEAERALADNARQKFHDRWEREVSARHRDAAERAKKLPKLP